MDFIANYKFNNFINLSVEELFIVLNWRNHESVRKWMFNQNIISLKDHENFIDGLQNDFTQKYWLVFRNEKPIGVSSIVGINNDQAEWGYYIAPEHHDSTLGVEFYYFTLRFLFNNIKLKKIYGYELRNNQGASSLNSLFGFTKQKTIKRINDVEYDVNYRELFSELWMNKIINDKRILKLLEFSLNRNLIL